MSTFKKISALILGSSTLLAANAFAYEAGDFVLRGGTATVDTKSKSDDLDQMAGAQVSAGTDTQFGISGTYMFTENWGLELIAATPFSHDLEGEGALDGVDIGSVKHLPPTVSAQYFFMGNDSKWQPYLGAGLNYTTFFSGKTSSTLSSMGYKNLQLDDSFGLSAQAGVDYNINENWGINLTVMYADIGTTATLKGAGVADLTVDYDLDPMVYRLNAVYKF